ncbi:MAG: glycosyltransferase family 4 protein [Candidatus Moraniibacteriota bacterium]|nr:MAG: glycosyltransferase family 4 protein [Candidatus Moranbacteria bacterium]
MRILFLSKSYPPTIGGIENQNFELAEALKKHVSVTVIANTRGKKFLPFFLPYAFIKSLFLLRKHDVILLGDGVLAPLGLALSVFSPSKTYASVIHGLDITFAKKKSILGILYRFINIPSLSLLDHILAVGNETIQEAVSAGIPRKICTFIPNGINPSTVIAKRTRKDLEKLLERKLENTFVILRVGRFVEHKGVEWFIRNILPYLPEDVIFIAAGGLVKSKNAGDANFFPECKKTVQELKLQTKVHFFTNIPWKDMQTLYNTADIVVSPNIRIPGSMEGFGINAIEAGACSRAVIASDLDGLKDAVHNEKNGILLEPANKELWIKTLRELLDNKERRELLGKNAHDYVLKNFTREIMAEKYLKILRTKRKK